MWHTRRMNTRVTTNPDKRHRFPAGIISHGVCLYFRFCLSYRDVEELMPVRGVIVTYEAILRSTIILSLRRKRVGVQTTWTELDAKQHWTRDFRAGIIARDNNPYLRGTPWRWHDSRTGSVPSCRSYVCC
jgi:hypothetical protein